MMERVEKWEAERNAERAVIFTDADREVIAEIHRRFAPAPETKPEALAGGNGTAR